MESSKSWWASRTIWASIIQMLIGIATTAGFINDAAGEIIIAEGPGIVIGLVMWATGAWAAYGRISATKVISS